MRSSFKLYPIDVAQALQPVRFALCLSVLCFSVAMHAQAAPSAATGQNAAPSVVPEAAKPSISLSPAVVMAKGNFGQGLTQTLTLTNQTGRDFAFDLIAEDVVVKDGKRGFVDVGITHKSI